MSRRRLPTSLCVSRSSNVYVSSSAMAVAEPHAHDETLVALAKRAAPEGVLREMSSRQIVKLIDAFSRLDAMLSLVDGELNAWVGLVRLKHTETPLQARDQDLLEAALKVLNIDATWIKRSSMISFWQDIAAGNQESKVLRAFTDEDMRAVFDSIDTDGSGDIDLKELKAAITQIQPGANAEQMLAFGDVDGDLEVSFDEFKRIMTSAADHTKVMLV
mmetsp:Transcript_20854/g.42343  ORF Transcript_20854/g.42343 Transcript_20854/m.42343 type:complete len:217 (-) Transcript_20854:252-902(-)